MPPNGKRSATNSAESGTRRPGTGVYYAAPVHKQPPYQHFDDPPCPEAERAADGMFSIPIHPALSEDDWARVAQAIAAL